MVYKIKRFLTVLFLFAFITPAALCADTEGTHDDAEALKDKSIESASVSPFGRTLFYVHGNIGSADAEKRAENISQNIRKLKNDILFRPSLLRISAEDGTLDIFYMGNVIAGTTEKEAKIEGTTKEDLARSRLNIIASAVEKERSGNIRAIVAKQAALFLLIFALAYFAIKYLNVLYRYVIRLTSREKNDAGKAISSIVSVSKQVKFFTVVLNVLRVSILVFVLYVFFLLLLSVFPATKWAADTLLSYIAIPLKNALIAIWNYLPNLFAIAVILFLARIVDKFLKLIAERVEKGSIKINNFHEEWALPTYHLIRIVLVIFVFIFVFPLLPNSNSAVFKGISVFIGVLLSLGSTSIINNIVSGFVITYMRPFSVGDRIKMGEHFGDVIEKSSLVTRIKTIKNEIITIPNSNIMTASTINYTHSAKDYGLILTGDITIGYDIPWRKVHALLAEAAKNTPYVMKDREPTVFQTALDDTSVRYQLQVYTDDATKMLQIESGLKQNMLDVFFREGIEIMSPVVNAHRNGTEKAIPKEYLKPEDYNAKPVVVEVKENK
ncbi:MAG: mechanosensitive ion channel [Endomicrobia bacterium]|nr:mechanosensitive ion channel [Endomicrobiia bacterium]